MKILHISSYYIGSNLYKHLLRALDQRGVEQTMFVPTAKNYEADTKKDPELHRGEIVYAKAFGKLDRLLYLSKIKKIYRMAEKNLDIQSFDTVHAHSLFINGAVAYQLKKKYHKEYIVAVRGTDLNVFFKKAPHLRKFGVRILKNAKKIIMLSPAYSDRLLKNYISEKDRGLIEDKIQIIPNGIEEFWIENKHQKKDVGGKKLELLYVGQFIKRKNIPLCVEVTKALRNKGYDAEITIVGKGAEEPVVRQLEQENQNFVTVYNWVDGREKLAKLYRDSRVFITPSLRETFGLVYLESMSQGTPVIYTRGEGFDRQFEDGYIGYGVELHPEDIVEKIEKICQQYQALSHNCYKEIDNYSWNKIAATYHEVYQKAR